MPVCLYLQLCVMRDPRRFAFADGSCICIIGSPLWIQIETKHIHVTDIGTGYVYFWQVGEVSSLPCSAESTCSCCICVHFRSIACHIDGHPVQARYQYSITALSKVNQVSQSIGIIVLTMCSCTIVCVCLHKEKVWRLCRYRKLTGFKMHQ